jgi:beta-xylosidase
LRRKTTRLRRKISVAGLGVLVGDVEALLRPMLIQNPILNGFNPDISICCVGDDCDIAASTFEWFPGVPIHHSKDLTHLQLLCRVLDRGSQLDMRGCQNSRGISVPCLTHADGKKYVVEMQMGEASSGVRLDGIWLREFDVMKNEWIGRARKIWECSPICITKGPQHLRKDGLYHLSTAEGRTLLRHAISVCRSRKIRAATKFIPTTRFSSLIRTAIAATISMINRLIEPIPYHENQLVTLTFCRHICFRR